MKRFVFRHNMWTSQHGPMCFFVLECDFTPMLLCMALLFTMSMMTFLLFLLISVFSLKDWLYFYLFLEICWIYSSYSLKEIVDRDYVERWRGQIIGPNCRSQGSAQTHLKLSLVTCKASCAKRETSVRHHPRRVALLLFSPLISQHAGLIGP